MSYNRLRCLDAYGCEQGLVGCGNEPTTHFINTTESLQYVLNNNYNYTTKGNGSVKSDGNLKKPTASPLKAENEISEGAADFDCNKDGYMTNGTECVNINECEEGSHTCKNDDDCIDNDGSFDCSCEEGLSWDGIECVELKQCGDESTDGKTPCIPGVGSRVVPSGINLMTSILMALGVFVLLNQPN